MYLHSRFILLLLLLLGYRSATASWTHYDSLAFTQNKSHIFYDNIRSAKLQLNGAGLINPVLQLHTADVLTIAYDELDGDGSPYSYQLIHCNADWQASSLSADEYLTGFNDLTIQHIENSMNTKQRYVHYHFNFPSPDMQPKVSGNYLLRIYQNDAADPAWQQRIYIVDNQLPLVSKINYARTTALRGSQQEVQVQVPLDGLQIDNVNTQCHLRVLQNIRQDREIYMNAPRFQTLDKLTYDAATQVLPAGNEYRDFDTRTIRIKGRNIEKIQILPDENHITVSPCSIRSTEPYTNTQDINGHYVVEWNENKMPDTDADYCMMHFLLMLPAPIANTKIYIVGEFTMFEPDPLYEMNYDTTHSVYLADVKMKQGYYNYAIQLVKNGISDESLTEGDFEKTENNYTSFFYFRAFNARFDQLIGMGNVSSNW